MSKVLAGDAANVTTPLYASVVGIADNGSGAERFQTSAPHLFGQANFVQLTLTIAAAQVYQHGTIDVIDATHFDLVGSTYTATGTGDAYDLSLTPQILVPTDGDTASLQLSGMLSGLQALADRTQALRSEMVARAIIWETTGSTVTAAIPPGCTAILAFGAGGGGGGGGSQGGLTADTRQTSGGGGGAGAPLTIRLNTSIPTDATAVDITIGTGGAGGSAGNVGSDGATSTCKWHDGASAGQTFAAFVGGAGGGARLGLCGSSILTGGGSTPAFCPGGRGPAGLCRSGPGGLQRSPGAGQLCNLLNNTGTVTADTWTTDLYNDPVGPMRPSDGGASVSNGANATYVGAVSYDGAPSLQGFAGGTAGADGAAHTNPGGPGGGGGGGGAFGAGGNGGAGGAGSAAGTAGDGTAGSAGSRTGGGGGGGGGGAGQVAGGAGAAGAAGGSGYVQLLFIGSPDLG